MKREFGDYVHDIVETMDKVVEFIRGMSYNDFVKDETVPSFLRTPDRSPGQAQESRCTLT